MNLPESANAPATENRTFMALLIAVSLAFAAILWPFYGAVFWGAVLAVLFMPLNRRVLQRMPGRPTLAALLTLVSVLLVVVLPMMVLVASLVQDGALIYQRVQSGELSFARYFEQITGALPDWITGLLGRFGLTDLESLERRILAGLTQGGQAIALQVFSIGQNTLDLVVSFFIALYLAFFLLRDGVRLARRIGHALPMNEAHKQHLAAKFFTVIRATVKGNVLVAATQGTLGGIAFAVLGINAAVFWAVVMAFLSLLPAIGAGLVWAPVAIYLLVTGAVWQGVGLVAYGVLVIGMVDNVLRPILVGKDTKMPDYIVLISTIGGMSLFGINGFVIGPVVAAMFMSVWDIFATARREGAKSAAESAATPTPALVALGASAEALPADPPVNPSLPAAQPTTPTPPAAPG